MRANIHIAVVALSLMACAKGIDPPEATAVRPIAGGTFTLGSSDYDPCETSRVDNNGTVLECAGATMSEMVRAEATLDNFCIDEHEVTIDQFRHCVALGECKKPASTNAGNRGDGFIEKYYGDPGKYSDYPVLGVTWEGAQEYCTFRNGRLPTEVEWEFVATSRGTRALGLEAGEEALRDVAADCADNKSKLAFGPCSDSEVREVKTSSADKTAQGIFDMAANAQEWTADEFDYLVYCDANQPGGAALTDLYVIDGERPVPAAGSAWPDTLLTVDIEACLTAADAEDQNKYSGKCNDQAQACLAVCVGAWDLNVQTPEKQTTWQKFDCEARFRTDVDCGECADDAPEECQAQCACRASPREAAASDQKCIDTCFGEYATCVENCASPGVSTACLRDGRDPRPRPVCRGRTYGPEDASTPHVTPDTFVSDDIRGRHVARGAHFQETEACGLRPSRRVAKNVSSPLVGFRCAYTFGAGSCR